MYFRNLLAATFLLIGIMAFTQTKKINQLKTKVDAATNNEEKLAAIIAYCEDYSNIALDSLEKYAYVALDLAAKSKRIAEITGISVLTVRKHISNTYQKLHINSKAQAMRIAYDKGLIN